MAGRIFPSRTIAGYTAKMFLVRTFAFLAALVVILQTLDLLGESGKILATGSFELTDGITTLFDHFGHDSDDLFIVELDTGIDFTLLDGSHEQTNGVEAICFARFHGGLHVVLNTVFEAGRSHDGLNPKRVLKRQKPPG